jgi:hypothetical protein
MARNRVIYNCEAVYVGETPCTGAHKGVALGNTWYEVAHEIRRVQDASYGFNIPRRDVNQFGELAAIDRVVVEAPTASFGFSYLAHSFSAESGIGFKVNQVNFGFTGSDVVTLASNQSCLTQILSRSGEPRNYFALTLIEGRDASYEPNDPTTETFWTGATAIGVGNGYISSYSAEGSVGNFPRTQVQIEGFNIRFMKASGWAGPLTDTYEGWIGTAFSDAEGIPTTGYIFHNPSVFPSSGISVSPVPGLGHPSGLNMSILPIHTTSQEPVLNDSTYGRMVSVIKPGDITLDLKQYETMTDVAEAGLDISDAKIQGYNLNLPFSRQPLNKLGSKFPFSQEIEFPIQITLQVDAIVGDLVTGNLSDIVALDKKYNLNVNLKGNQRGVITSSTNHIIMRYRILGAKLDSVSYNSSLAGQKTASLSFSCQVGSSNQTGVGLFMDGDLSPFDASYT